VTAGGRVAGVETGRGRVSAPVVVLVPGAWGQALLDPLGLDFGLVPYRIQVSLFRWPASLTGKHPVVIDAGQKAWIRPVDGSLTLIGVELGAAYGGDPDKLHEGVDEGYVALYREHLSHRLPLFADSTMRGGWAGMIMMSPDGRPIIDQIPSVPGLYVMLGDSGTSFASEGSRMSRLRRPASISCLTLTAHSTRRLRAQSSNTWPRRSRRSRRFGAC
jgi:sarcosine oxidase subunit beta